MNPLPTSREAWLNEIARAFRDAIEAIPFGPLVGESFGADELFHLGHGQEREFFKSLGLDIGELLPQDGPEARRRYLTRRDGSIAFAVTPPIASAPSPIGWVAELVVPKR